MSLHPHILWSQLRIGLAVSLAVTASAVMVFFIDDVRDAVEDRYPLYFHTFTTQPLRPRASVWLAGQPVGYVRALRLEPPTRDRGELLQVELSVSATVQPFITEGAAAQVISSSLLGEAVVNILPASEPGAPLQSGDELPTVQELDPFQVSRNLQIISDSVSPVADRWRQVFEQLHSGRGTLPLLLQRRESMLDMHGQLRELAAVFDTIRMAADGFSTLLADGETRAALSRIGPRFERLGQRWAGSAGSVSRFASDTVLEARLDILAARIGRIAHRLDTGRGTLGRLSNDRALADELAKTREALRELRADLKGRGGNRP